MVFNFHAQSNMFPIPDVCNPESICHTTIDCPWQNVRERRSCVIAAADSVVDQSIAHAGFTILVYWSLARCSFATLSSLLFNT